MGISAFDACNMGFIVGGKMTKKVWVMCRKEKALRLVPFIDAKLLD